MSHASQRPSKYWVMAKRESQWVRLGDYIKQIDRWNTDLKYGLDDIRGVSNTKEMMPTKANMEGRDLSTFQVLMPGEFIFNRRTTRNGERIGLGYNMDDRAYIFTEDYVSFAVKEGLLPTYLYLFFCRDEFDRYVRYHSWGSATEFFNWEEMCEVKIPLPLIDDKPDMKRQQEVVDAWQGLRKMKEQNEQLAAPLFQLCRSYMENLKKNCKFVELREYIENVDERNYNNQYNLDDLKGLSVEKTFIDSKANMDGVSLSAYKVVAPSHFCFVTVTSRNSDKITIALNNRNMSYIVSSSYEVFRVINVETINPHFLLLWFKRPEFDRYARFHSWGSAREAFSYEDMEKVKIPLPDLATQQAIVNIYHCAEEAKRIAAEADKLSREICPALMQHIIHEAETNDNQ